MGNITRRRLLGGGLALGGGLVLSACTPSPSGSPLTPTPRVPATVPASPRPGQPIIEKTLRAAPVDVDLGGPVVRTWAYGDTVPGVELRATAGDFLRITLDNQLPDPTSIHWHGIALENAADGVPGMTQEAVRPGEKFVYEFTVPDPGTYFFHPHVGVQLDRGLYAPLIVEDPNEPGGYDAEWVVVLDDWLDGTGRTPDEVLTELTANNAATPGGMPGMNHGSGGMGGMDHGGMGTPPFGDSGDVTYPHFLINGAIPESPVAFEAKPGQRVRLRVINAGSDTLFTLALGGHRMTVTHTDGFAVDPHETDALYIGMGERYDLLITLGDGVFPLVAKPWGKEGQAFALVRTGAGAAPRPTVDLPEFGRSVVQGADLHPAQSTMLPDRTPDVRLPIQFGGQMAPYVWTINGDVFGKNAPLEVERGQRVQLDVMNMTMMTHPLHVHGHTFALPSGLRKDTVLVPPMGSMALQLEATNPGVWAVHCHNIYHGEVGMMVALQYRQDKEK